MTLLPVLNRSPDRLSTGPGDRVCTGGDSVKRCVLIADDHEIVRARIASTFKSHGFEVRDAANGAEAVTKAREAHPNPIVLDLAMPVMNGFEAARILHSLMPEVQCSQATLGRSSSKRHIPLAFPSLFLRAEPSLWNRLVKSAISLLEPIPSSN
jgi:CheY-like chemotaxis protein